ncbi:uncharacterized protein PV07_11305 [Cladophialophora immunda]|uniref:C2H2-type domain-containing protein n=1 Tax=Cladophialophora immunda TaxID=569365 RepID=A0A0D1Z669_9EURO|nr:uncharacterized protein PV07_11305 [Cladophialophora immunda]KIW23076.1 hypothetical protein PV07_11305 [Cladophialophora immunda]OQU93598.1 hypothetical protein CLAIMM_00082 [Cladophialophora immunda]
MVRENQLQILNEGATCVCIPCDRQFVFINGLLNHCRNAEVHQGEWCERCQWLFVSPAARQAHVDNSPRHNICTPCDLDFSTAALLESHDVDVHNMCMDCGKYFRKVNDLMQHKRSHLPLEIECLGCDRLFSEFSAMMIHLESGNCESGIDRDDIDSYIRDCGYVNELYDGLMYQCPDCEADFRFASALCQHVASNACNQNPEDTFNDIESCIKCYV